MAVNNDRPVDNNGYVIAEDHGENAGGNGNVNPTDGDASTVDAGTVKVSGGGGATNNVADATGNASPGSGTDPLSRQLDHMVAGSDLTAPWMPSVSDNNSPTSFNFALQGSGNVTNSPLNVQLTNTTAPLDQAPRATRSQFDALHAGDSAYTGRVYDNAQFVQPTTNQSWESLVKQGYGQLMEGVTIPPYQAGHIPDETWALIAEAVARKNGVSTLEAPPEVVAIPEFKDLQAIIGSMKTTVEQQLESPSELRPGAARFVPEGTTDRPLPTAGHTYNTRWNDSLRGVVLNAYRDQLAGLEEGPANERLQQLMLMVAVKNRLPSTDLGNVGKIWLPTSDQAERSLVALQLDPTKIERFKARNEHRWEAITREGVRANRDLAYLAEHPPVVATSREELQRVLTQADAVIEATVEVQQSQALVNAFTGGVSMFGFNFGFLDPDFLHWMFPADTAQDGELAVRRPDEEFGDYLFRLKPDMSPAQLRRATDDPEYLSAILFGTIGADGEIDLEKKAVVDQQLAQLGLTATDGGYTLPPHCANTDIYGVRERVIKMALTNMGVEFDAEASLDTILAGAKDQLNPQQKQMLRAVQGLTAGLVNEAETAGIADQILTEEDVVQLSQTMSEYSYASYSPIAYGGMGDFWEDPQLDFLYEPTYDNFSDGNFWSSTSEATEAEQETAGILAEADSLLRVLEQNAPAGTSPLLNLEQFMALWQEFRSSNQVMERNLEMATEAHVKAVEIAKGVNQAAAKAVDDPNVRAVHQRGHGK